MLIVDSFITIPLLPILIILGALIRGNTSFLTVGFIIMIFGWAWGARTIRSMALSLREREFINMARFSGANTFEIILREVFPYVYRVHARRLHQHRCSFAINTEATLAVIGLSKVEVPTLGSIIFWALNYNALFIGNYRLARRADRRDGRAVPRPLPPLDRLQRGLRQRAGCPMIRLNNIVASYTHRPRVRSTPSTASRSTIPDGCIAGRRGRIRLRQVAP